MATLREYLNGLSKEVLIEEYVALLAARDNIYQQAEWAVDLLLGLATGAELSMEEIVETPVFSRGAVAKEHLERLSEATGAIYEALQTSREEAEAYVTSRVMEA